MRSLRPPARIVIIGAGAALAAAVLFAARPAGDVILLLAGYLSWGAQILFR